MRVAIVHERFTELGGSESVVEALHAMWPDVTIFAPVVDPAALPTGLRGKHIVTSPLQRVYRGGRGYAHLLPLLPLAMARFDLRGFDVVITSHHAFSNRVRAPRGVPVISYTYTPARWIWDPRTRADEAGGRLGRIALDGFSRTQRRPDAAAAARAHKILVISHHVAKRVDAWWGQPATVVPPPVDLDTYTPDPQTQREDFFLLAGRLVPYKRPLVAVDAARAAGVPLVVVGDGRLRANVCARADGNIKVLGRVDQTTLRNLYRRCRALVFPGEEDFGIVPVEAQACGTPVLARAVGGVLDTVTDGVTGMLYQQGTRSEVHALRDAMLTFDPTVYDPATIRAHTERFSASAFRSRVQAEVERALGGTTPTGSSPPSGTP